MKNIAIICSFSLIFWGIFEVCVYTVYFQIKTIKRLNALSDIVPEVRCTAQKSTDAKHTECRKYIKTSFSIVWVWKEEPNESKTKHMSTWITILPLCWDLKRWEHRTALVPSSPRASTSPDDSVHQHFPAPGGKGHISNKQSPVSSAEKKKKMKPILNPTVGWLSYIACKVQ